VKGTTPSFFDSTTLSLSPDAVFEDRDSIPVVSSYNPTELCDSISARMHHQVLNVHSCF